MSYCIIPALRRRGHSLTACDAAPPATPHRLQHLPAHFIQNGRCGPGIGQTLGYWILRSTFAKLVFGLDHSFYENLKNPKWPLGGPKMADGVWKGVQP